MILIGIIIIGIILVAVSNDDDIQFTGGLSATLAFICWALIVIFIIPFPAQYTAKYTSLQAQYKYIQALPAVSTQNAPNFNLANLEVERDIIKETITFWDKAEQYNAVIYFWHKHPNLDLWVLGFPRISPTLSKLPLIKQ
jgi:hypothetical protein